MKYKGYFSGKTRSQAKTSVKVIVIAAVIFAVFIPAIVAGVIYSLKSNNIDTSHENLMQVSLYLGDTLIHDEKENPKNAVEGGLVDIFNSLANNKVQANSIPAGAYDNKMIKAVISYNSTVSEYKCYFSTDGTKSYCLDAAGNKYIIDDSSASKFVNSSYAELLYRVATPPALYTTSNDAVVPSSAEWYFCTLAGEELKAAAIPTEKEEITYDMAGALGIRFETEPDSCLIKVYKSGIIIHETTELDLSLITVDPGTTLQLKITAIWEKSEEREFFGEVLYNFKVLVRNRSEFILDKTEFTVGEMAVVSCTNVLDIDKIQFRSEPDIGFTPTFFKNNDMVYALIPFDYDLKAGEYLFTFSYGATVQTVSVDLATRIQKPANITVSDEQSLSAAVNEASLRELSEILKDLSNPYEEYVFFRTAFVDYTESGASSLYGFGTLFNAVEANISHVIKGTLYSMASGDGASVGALNGGVVIYRGECDYLGRFVVIEHGLGLRTVYGHLSAFNVSVGDSVAKGQTIGRTGFSAGAGYDGVFIACYVFDIPIDYATLAGKAPALFVPEAETDSK